MAKDGTRPGRDGTILRLQNQPHQSRSQMNESRMPHRMQDHLQHTMVISQRRSQKTHTEQAASWAKGNATRAREWPEEAKRLFKHKCQGAEEAETVNNDAIKGTLEKTEALEKLVRTVTMTAVSSATAEADFFQTLLERQKDTQRNLIPTSASGRQ